MSAEQRPVAADHGWPPVKLSDGRTIDRFVATVELNASQLLAQSPEQQVEVLKVVAGDVFTQLYADLQRVAALAVADGQAGPP